MEPDSSKAATAVIRDLFIVNKFGSTELKIGVFAKKTKANRWKPPVCGTGTALPSDFCIILFEEFLELPVGGNDLVILVDDQICEWL